VRDDDRADWVLHRLQEAGARLTRPRQAVVAALVAADGHVTAEDLAASVQDEHPDVHLSTVYRTLDALEQLGVVDHVHLGHGCAVYHLTDERHQHLVCESCGNVVEVPDALFASLARRIRQAYGFRIRPDHFAVPGQCRACAAGTPE
jgi:Fur family ferric uptake transcriptional regulator